MTIAKEDFDCIATIVRDEAGIVLEAGKEYLVETRLNALARKEGLLTCAEVIESVRKNPRGPIRKKVIDSLTTNETSFFRDIEPYEMLKKTIIPELMEKRASQRAIKIWCAASSTGQEPYSLAMLIKESFPALAEWRVDIVATDISTEILERARQGVFTQMEVNRGLPAIYLVKYFKKVGNEWHLSDDIKRMVTFAECNLLRPLTVVSAVDIVLIRNVLIYFDVQTKSDILRRISLVLPKDGFLLLGAAETTIGLDTSFDRRVIGKCSCYQLR